MNLRKEWKPIFIIIAVFLISYFLPIEHNRVINSIAESLHLLKSYAREHVLTCLIPAFFIAGAIAIFISQASVMKYLGAQANKVVAYGVASVSGSILAVCSCTVLPLFAGIYQMGAGLGPATAFLYAGPAINVLAIILTARVLGFEMGVARAVGAIGFSIVIGLLMQFIFRNEKLERDRITMQAPIESEGRPLWQTGLFFAVLVGILVFANWSAPQQETGIWYILYAYKWHITGIAGLILGIILHVYFGISWVKIIIAAIPVILLSLIFPLHPSIAFSVAIIGFSTLLITGKGEAEEWFDSSWEFAKQIFPLLFIGVLVAGALLGRPGHEALIPAEWVHTAVGGNSIRANFLASIVGAFMYFATLTEIPILEGLMGSGMGKGPALALLLAGPALSLPNMLVIRSVVGTKKTVVFVSLVVIMATITGMLFGAFFG